MARKTTNRKAKKTTALDRFAQNPSGTLVNEAAKVGIPKRITKAAMGLTLIGAISGLAANQIASLPVIGKFAAVPLSWGQRIRGKLRL